MTTPSTLRFTILFFMFYLCSTFTDRPVRAIAIALRDGISLSQPITVKLMQEKTSNRMPDMALEN